MERLMIWKFDHAEELSWDEYDYWMSHRLPFGWSVTSPPRTPRQP